MTELFGGAISTVLNDKVINVATIRPVPDTQEVFILEFGPSNISIIFDILEPPHKDIDQAIDIHIRDVFDDNAYVKMDKLEVKALNTEANVVNVILANAKALVAIIRLDKVFTDILVTCNYPDRENDTEHERLAIKNKAKDLFSQAVSNLTVNEWSLFDVDS